MMMHVTPAQIRAAARPPASDAALIKLCRLAIKTLQADLEACEGRDAAEKAATERRPLYPHPALPHSRIGRSSASLRAELKVQLAKKVYVGSWWRRQQLEHIRQVEAWERKVRAIDRSLRLKTLCAVSDRAVEQSRKAVRRVAEKPACSIEDLACKSEVVDHWLNAGYGLTDEGELLVNAILGDIRMLDTSARART
jgi:hypothetical protein